MICMEALRACTSAEPNGARDANRFQTYFNGCGWEQYV